MHQAIVLILTSSQADWALHQVVVSVAWFVSRCLWSNFGEEGPLCLRELSPSGTTQTIQHQHIVFLVVRGLLLLLKAESGERTLFLSWMIATLFASQRIELLIFLLYTEDFSDLQLRHDDSLLRLNNILACTLLGSLSLSGPSNVAYRARLSIEQTSHIPISRRSQVCWFVALIAQIVILPACIPDQTQTSWFQRIFLIHGVLNVN